MWICEPLECVYFKPFHSRDLSDLVYLEPADYSEWCQKTATSILNGNCLIKNLSEEQQAFGIADIGDKEMNCS